LHATAADATRAAATATIAGFFRGMSVGHARCKSGAVMKTTHLLATALFAAAFATPALSQARPDPMNDLRNALSAIAGSGGRGEQAVHAADACVAAYNELHAEGTPDSRTVSHAPFGTLKGSSHTLGEIRDACKATGKLAGLQKFTDEIQGAVGSALQQLKGIKREADMKMVANTVAQCNKAVDEGLAAGVPSDYAIEFSELSERAGWKGTVAHVKVEVCAKLEAAAKQTGTDRLAPYLAVGMKNDKLKMITQNADQTYFQIAGGEVTLDAKKLAASNVWFMTYDAGTCASGKPANGTASANRIAEMPTIANAALRSLRVAGKVDRNVLRSLGASTSISRKPA